MDRRDGDGDSGQDAIEIDCTARVQRGLRSGKRFRLSEAADRIYMDVLRTPRVDADCWTAAVKARLEAWRMQEAREGVGETVTNVSCGDG